MKRIIIALLALTLCTTVACSCGNQEPTAFDEFTETAIAVQTDTNLIPEVVATEETKKGSNKEETEAQTETATEATTEKVTETSTQATTKKNNKKETKATKPTTPKAKKTIVKNGYFSLTMPASWYDKYTYEIIDKKHIYINHKASTDVGFTGNLFSVEMFGADEDYTVYPIHTYINTVQTKDGEVYDIVAVYPSDSQCPERMLSDYTRFANQSESIIKTIKYDKKLTVVQ